MKTPSYVHAAVEGLFRRFSSLCGFTVVERQGEFALVDVALYSWTGCGVPEEIRGEIAAALLQLVDERPETRELLVDRTFARTLH